MTYKEIYSKLKASVEKENFQILHILTEKQTMISDDIQALEFSTDIDRLGKYQTKDGKWHEGKIPLKEDI